MDFPWTATEGRDQQDGAAVIYHERQKRRKLQDENFELKRLLRQHGICWSPAVEHHTGFFKGSFNHRFANVDRKGPRTRSLTAPFRWMNRTAPADQGPRVPAELILRIVKFAMTSSMPIIDPLSKPNLELMTSAEERFGSGVAIGLMAVSKAINFEAANILWSKNTFIFTSPQALSSFAELAPEFRSKIKHINLRIVARFYHESLDHLSLKKRDHANLPHKTMNIKLNLRPKAHKAAWPGLRAYSWLQIVDFLDALRPLYQPPPHRHASPELEGHNKSSKSRLLLPNLDSMRIDLVNFATDLLQAEPGEELHNMAAHDLSCTLSELVVTGLPCCSPGIKAGLELSQMLRDNGLFIDASPTYSMVGSARPKKLVTPTVFSPRVVRPRPLEEMSEATKKIYEVKGDGDFHYRPVLYGADRFGHSHGDGYNPDPVPLPLEGPYSCQYDEIWKQVPISLDDPDKREWVCFEVDFGYKEIDVFNDASMYLDSEMEDDDEDYLSILGELEDDMDPDHKRVVCVKCKKVHDEAYDNL